MVEVEGFPNKEVHSHKYLFFNPFMPFDSIVKLWCMWDKGTTFFLLVNDEVILGGKFTLKKKSILCGISYTCRLMWQFDIISIISLIEYSAGQKFCTLIPWIFCDSPGGGRPTLKMVEYEL